MSVSSIPRKTLQSISQQPESHPPPKTQVQLLSVYYNMFCLQNYPKHCIDAVNPKQIFESINAKIEQDNTQVNELMDWYFDDRPMNQKYTHDRQVQLQYFMRVGEYSKDRINGQVNNKLLSNKKFISKQQFEEIMKKRGSPIKNKQQHRQKMLNRILNSNIKQQKTQSRRVSIDKHTQTNIKQIQNQQYINFKQSQTTVSDLLSKLDDFDEERSRIKSCIYTGTNCKTSNSLYVEWGSLHLSMKDLLEQLIDKLSQGQSITQIYKQFFDDSNNGDNQLYSERLSASKSQSINYSTKPRELQRHRIQQIQGIDKKQIMMKLDQYLQSLYMDERQLMIYNNEVKRKTEESKKSLMNTLKNMQIQDTNSKEHKNNSRNSSGSTARNKQKQHKYSDHFIGTLNPNNPNLAHQHTHLKNTNRNQNITKSKNFIGSIPSSQNQIHVINHNKYAAKYIPSTHPNNTSNTLNNSKINISTTKNISTNDSIYEQPNIVKRISF